MASGVHLVFEALPEARVLVSCQTKFNPSDLEWDSWLNEAINLDRRVGEFRLVVVSDGGHPTKSQVERLKATNRKNPLTAIVSPSLALRFMGAALTFVNPTIRCFPPSEFESAFDHIRLGRSEREPVLAAVARLQATLGAQPAPDHSSARAR